MLLLKFPKKWNNQVGALVEQNTDLEMLMPRDFLPELSEIKTLGPLLSVVLGLEG